MYCNWFLPSLNHFTWDSAEATRTKGFWFWKTGFSEETASRELQRSWKWFSYFLFVHSSLLHSVLLALVLGSCWWFLCFVSVCVVLKPKSKERFRWWTSMTYQNPRTPSLQRTKVVVVVVLTGGIGDWLRQIHTYRGYLRQIGSSKTGFASYFGFLKSRKRKQERLFFGIT